MIKSELRFLYKPSIIIANNCFQNLGTNWTGNTAYYVNLPSNVTVGDQTSYPVISGWTYQTIEGDNSIWMRSDLGSTEAMWQDLEPIQDPNFDGGTYQISFTIKSSDNSTGGVTVYLNGYSGTTVTANGSYQQSIYIQSGMTQAPMQIQIIPESGFTGGISNLAITPLNSVIKPIDLYDDDAFSLTFQNFSDLASRSSNYSKTIKLPGTNNNNKAFKMLLDQNMWFGSNESGNSFTNVMFFNKRIPAGLYYDTIQLTTGYFELERCIKNQFFIEYEGTFYSEVKNLADVIGDKKLYGNDDPLDNLDYSEYDHIYNLQNILATYSIRHNYYTTSTGVFYPFIDFQGFNDFNILDISNVRPAIYAKELWDKIFTKAGFQYTSQFLTGSTEFKSLVIPLTKSVAEDTFELDKHLFQVGITPNASGATAGVGYGKYAHGSASQGAEYWNGPDYSPPPATLPCGASDYWFKCDLHNFATFSTSQFRSQFLPFDVTSGCITNGTGSTIFFNNSGSTGLAWNTTEKCWDVKRSGNYKLHCFVTFDLYGKAFLGNNANFTGAWYAGDEYGQYNSFEIKLTYFKKSLAGNWINISETVDDVYLDTQTQFAQYPGTKGEDWIATNQTITNDLNEVDLYVGEKVKVQLAIGGGVDRCCWHSVGTPTVGGYGSRVQAWMFVNRTFTYFNNSYNNKPYLYEGNKVVINKILPDMKQIDFVKSICDMYNLVIAEDKETTGNLVIEPFDTFYKNTYVDWTQKVDDTTKEISRIPYIVNKSVLLTLQKDNSDALSKKYIEEYTSASGSLQINNPYLNEGTYKIETAFSNSFIKNFGSTNWLMSCLYDESKRDTWLNDGKRSDQTYSTKIMSRRLLQPNELSGETLNTIYLRCYLTGVTSGITNGVNWSKPGDFAFGSGSVRNYFPYAGHWNNPYNPTFDLNYGVSHYYYSKLHRYTTFNLFKNYWKTKLSLFLDPNSKLVKFKIRLNQTDIMRLDFRKKVLIENTFYIISKIIDWTPNGECEIELLKLSYYDLPYWVDVPTWKVFQSNGCTTTGGSVQGGSVGGVGGGVGTLPTGENLVINLGGGNFSNIATQNMDGLINSTNANSVENQYPSNAIGIVMGKSNVINSTNFFINGDNNIIDTPNVTIMNSKNNIIQQDNYVLIGSDNNTILSYTGFTNPSDSDSGFTGSTYVYTKPGIMMNSYNNTVDNSRVVLINASDNTINTGLTDVVIMNSTGLTISQSGKTYINNRDVDDLTDTTYVSSNYFNKADDIKVASGKKIISDTYTTLSGTTEVSGVTDSFVYGGRTYVFQNGILISVY